MGAGSVVVKRWRKWRGEGINKLANDAEVQDKVVNGGDGGDGGEKRRVEVMRKGDRGKGRQRRKVEEDNDLNSGTEQQNTVVMVSGDEGVDGRQ